MNQTPTADQVLGQLIAWARSQHDVRMVAVIGSRARTDHGADEWSDTDIMLVTTRPNDYLLTAAWLGSFGRPWFTYATTTPAGGQAERRVVFDGAVEFDFAVVPRRTLTLAAHVLALMARFPRVARLLPQQASNQLALLAEMVRRGMRVELDKDGLATRLQRVEISARPSRPPTESEFVDVVLKFWHGPIWVAKHLHRGELWRIKTVSEPRRNELLLQMFEWHARARNGWDYQTWDSGRFLEEWADHRAVDKLRNVFGAYDAESLWQALFATMDLFRWLAMETAAALAYRYPHEVDERVTKWLMDCRARTSEEAAASS